MKNVVIENSLGISENDCIKMHEKIEEQENGCWNWVGSFSGKNGQVRCSSYSKNPVLVKKIMWELYNNKEMLYGLAVDQTCGNPSCCNPDHLTVCEREHLKRSKKPAKTKLKKETPQKTQTPQTKTPEHLAHERSMFLIDTPVKRDDGVVFKNVRHAVDHHKTTAYKLVQHLTGKTPQCAGFTWDWAE